MNKKKNRAPHAPKPITSDKIMSWPKLLKLRDGWRRKKLSVVWTNGCFDLLHVGHIRSLSAAKTRGDVLVVGMNSDASVASLKGPSRPLFPQNERAEMLAALSCVDAVVVFGEQTPNRSLQRLKPDVHCKGADYAPPHGKPMPEAPLVAAYGGRIEFLPLFEGVSTTTIVEKILSDTKPK